jgi:hypothetical protein
MFIRSNIAHFAVRSIGFFLTSMATFFVFWYAHRLILESMVAEGEYAFFKYQYEMEVALGTYAIPSVLVLLTVIAFQFYFFIVKLRRKS